MDVLCIGGRDFKLKSEALDLIVVPLEATKCEEWLQSELATHVGRYGIWIKGTPAWRNDVSVGQTVIGQKRRRVNAFMRSLQKSWLRLDECFRTKYSVKLRREAQRLILLEQNEAVPPTRILDFSWASLSRSPGEVSVCLRQFASEEDGSCMNDLLKRIEAHFH